MGKQKEEGITFTEIIFTVAIMAVLAAVAVPSLQKWLPNIRLKGAARELYSNMQKAKMLAVKTNRKTAITFDPANNRYQLCDNWNGACVGTVTTVDFNNFENGIGYGHGNSTKQANSAGTPWPLSPDDEVSYSNNRVIFNPNALGSAGYVYLDHQEGTTTYAVGSLSSGAIKLKRWMGGAWQ